MKDPGSSCEDENLNCQYRACGGGRVSIRQLLVAVLHFLLGLNNTTSEKKKFIGIFEH